MKLIFSRQALERNAPVLVCLVMILLLLALPTGFEGAVNYQEAERCSARVLSTDDSAIIDTGLVRSGEQLCELELLDGRRVREAAPCGGPLEPDTWFLRVRCSKGTYVRTLCHDIGRALGCGGTMFSLRRTMAAGFTLAQSHPLTEVLEHPDPASLLTPVDAYFSGRPELRLRPEAEKKVRNGVSFPLPGTEDGEYRVYGATGEFLSLSRVEGGTLRTIKSFFEV